MTSLNISKASRLFRFMFSARNKKNQLIRTLHANYWECISFFVTKPLFYFYFYLATLCCALCVVAASLITFLVSKYVARRIWQQTGGAWMTWWLIWYLVFHNRAPRLTINEHRLVAVAVSKLLHSLKMTLFHLTHFARFMNEWMNEIVTTHTQTRRVHCNRS